MASTPEYNLREFEGKWDRESDSLWCTPDVRFPGSGHHVWWHSGDGMYMDSSGQPIYFSGTDPRRPGYPPPEDESDVGTPEWQWEYELRQFSPEAWREYRLTGEW